MGSKPKQVNPAQAGAADSGASAAAAQSAGLSDVNNQEHQTLFNTLFGDPTRTGSSGSLSGFLDPNRLKVDRPGGTYGLQWNQAQDQIGKNYADQRGRLAENSANRGFSGGLPSGFEEDQSRKLAAAEADSRGQAFTNLAGRSYEDAKSNFWNAANIANGQSAGTDGAALQGAGQAGQTYSNLYGTAGRQASSNGFGSALGSKLGTAGGAVLCPALGALITMFDGTGKKVEDLEAGDSILQFGGGKATLTANPSHSIQRCVEISTDCGRHTVVGRNHAFVLKSGGYQDAEASVTERVLCLGKSGGSNGADTGDRDEEITSAVNTADRAVFLLELGGNHTYLCDGFWSLI